MRSTHWRLTSLGAEGGMTTVACGASEWPLTIKTKTRPEATDFLEGDKIEAVWDG
jgi:hypothetical protein